MRRPSLIVPALLLATAGCSTLSNNIHGDWACAAPDGTCAPMSSIDQQAILSIAGDVPQIRSMDTPGVRSPVDPLLAGFGSPMNPSRTPERTLRIIFPAYVDKAGLYFEPTAVHAVVANPAWSSVPDRSASAPAIRLEQSASASPPVPGSSLASLDDVIAARAVRRDALPRSQVPSPVPSSTLPPPTEAAAGTLSQRESQAGIPAAASSLGGATSLNLAAAAPLSATSGRAAPAATAGVGMVTPLPAPPVKQSLGSPSSPLVAASRNRPATSAVPSASPTSVEAPFGYRTVVWKGKRYRIARKSPPPVSAEAAAADQSADLVRALNKSSLKALDAPPVARAAAVSPPAGSPAALAAASEGDLDQ